MPLGHLDIDWVWLRDNLNKITDEINTNKPIGSSSIAVNESPNGALLSIIGAPGDSGSGGDSPWRITPSGETAGWHSIQVVDDNCNVKSMWVWGGTPS